MKSHEAKATILDYHWAGRWSSVAVLLPRPRRRTLRIRMIRFRLWFGFLLFLSGVGLMAFLLPTFSTIADFGIVVVTLAVPIVIMGLGCWILYRASLAARRLR